jgi:acyl carrier protein
MKLNGILKEVFSAKETEIKDESKLSDFSAWDSMAHMFFITKLEEEYGIELSGDEIADMFTVADVKKALDSRGKLDA